MGTSSSSGLDSVKGAVSMIASSILTPSSERLLAIVADVLVKDHLSPLSDDELSLPKVLAGLSFCSSLDMTTPFILSDSSSFWGDPIWL
jgi:hypothetical protein